MAHNKFLEKMSERLQILKNLHFECAEYYSRRNFYLYAPSIFITGASALISFLSSTSIVPMNYHSTFSIIVGVLTVGSTMIQSFSTNLKYDAKKEANEIAAEEYNKLLTKLQCEIFQPNEPNFINNLENNILEIKNKCKYFPPQLIYKKYENSLDMSKFYNNLNNNNIGIENNVIRNNNNNELNQNIYENHIIENNDDTTPLLNNSNTLTSNNTSNLYSQNNCSSLSNLISNKSLNQTSQKIIRYL